jgi:hypothetical protein
MKTTTKIADLEKYLAACKAAEQATAARDALDTQITASRDTAIAALDHYRLTLTEKAATESILHALPAERREKANVIRCTAEEIGKYAALVGADYSGTTRYLVRWTTAATPSASTTTAKGDQYSSGCKYHKMDADHLVHLAPAWVPCLIESSDLRSLSALEGLPLIGMHEDGRAVWVKSGKGKKITSEIGWIANFGRTCYHSTKSREDAERGLQKKLAAERREWQADQQRRADALRHAKDERRARLVARLCGSVTATLADAKALGFCTPGIESFQQRHGIGNSATLPQLVRTGNPSAVRLALAVARRVLRPAA